MLWLCLMHGYSQPEELILDEPESVEVPEDVPDSQRRPDTSKATDGSASSTPLHENNGSLFSNVYGLLQGKYEYHNIAKDAIESHDFSVRRFWVGAKGNWESLLYYDVSFHANTWNNYIGANNVFLEYRFNDLFNLKAGQFKKPFSGFELKDVSEMVATEMSFIYLPLLKEQNGYAGYDIGVGARGEFFNKLFSYELGLFHGLNRKDGYDAPDKINSYDYPILDAVARITMRPVEVLSLDASYSEKGTPPDSGGYRNISRNQAYQLGASLEVNNFKVRGEVALGDNHKGLDAYIEQGSQPFFAYLCDIQYLFFSQRNVKLYGVTKTEGADPAISKNIQDVNDAQTLYYLGVKGAYKKLSLAVGVFQRNNISEIQSDSDKHTRHFEMLISAGL